MTNADATVLNIAPHRADSVGELDIYLNAEGTHCRLYRCLGAHPCIRQDQSGVSFALWAPHAKRVSVVGDFNGWDGRHNPLDRLDSGIWAGFVPEARAGQCYKYELGLGDGQLRIKTDPVAFRMESPPHTASVICGLGDYRWHDAAWMEARRGAEPTRLPLAVYELHVGSWLASLPERTADSPLRQLAAPLAAHCRQHSFTHVELMPVAEHAFGPSWGYQTTGYYAPSARYGSPDDLRYFVDYCHMHGIGVILDWVPGHFPKDDFALRWFDGTALYEPADPRRSEQPDWGTLVFNFERPEVRSFLISNAIYWFDEFHVDGLRVDAVASMLYLDYSRQDGEWLPNQYGGRENLGAIEFLRQLNTSVYAEYPGVMMIAEESTAWPGVTKPVHLGGLGFGFKWNMGWMHDTLSHFGRDPVHRKYHHSELTFSMLYAYSEHFILPLSHDEVVHGKQSLLAKMPGDAWQQAANLRLLLAYQYTFVGKKLLFQGAEVGQPQEWHHDSGIDWSLTQHPFHAGVQRLVQDLGRLYLAHDALWAWDNEGRGFHWIDCNDAPQSIISFARWGPSGHLVCVFNLTPVPRYDYRLGVPRDGLYRELINSDSAHYAGSNLGNHGGVHSEAIPYHGQEYSVLINLPPLGALILRCD